MNPYESPREPTGEDGVGSSATKTIYFDGQLSLADVVEALRLAQTGQPVVTLRAILAMVLLPLLLLVWIAMLGYSQRKPDVGLMLAVGAGALLVAGLMIARHWWLPWLMAHRVRVGSPDMVARGEVGADGVVFAAPTQTTSYSWQAFGGYRKGGNVVLLYTRFPENFAFLAHRTFRSDADWELALEIIATNLAAR